MSSKINIILRLSAVILSGDEGKQTIQSIFSLTDRCLDGVYTERSECTQHDNMVDFKFLIINKLIISNSR